jgi:lysozyme family protein
MSHDAIPDGGGLQDGIAFLLNQDAMNEGYRRASKWVQEAIDAVKSAPDNPYGDNDEAIAEAILAKLDEKRRPREV